jgi:DNA-binding response OmpR family regulator
MHTLLIEDNIALAQTVTRYLANEDITCTLRTDGTEGYMEAIDNNYDVIILDIELPGMDGIEICRHLRTEGRATPIIMLTSRTTQDDIIAGLDYGADDYLSKPCDYRELVSRIRALSRRNHTHKSTEIMEIGSLRINQENH